MKKNSTEKKIGKDFRFSHLIESTNNTTDRQKDRKINVAFEWIWEKDRELHVYIGWLQLNGRSKMKKRKRKLVCRQ